MDAGVIMVGTIIAWTLVCGLFAWIENCAKCRKQDQKKLREMHQELCRLRAELTRQDHRAEYKLDSLRTELNIKELLLRQKWAEATRR